MKKILVEFNFPNTTSEKFDSTWTAIRAAGHSHPKGLVHHTAVANGKDWKVVDVWESEQAFKAFGEVLMPVLDKAGMPKVEPKITPVHFAYVTNELELAGTH